MFIKKFKKINHEAEAKDKLLYQFRDLKNINIILTVITKQLNDIEDTLEDMIYKFGVNDADGAQLDIIGSYKNVLRSGRNDEEFRTAIKNKIALDSSNGTCESALRATKMITGSNKFLYYEHHPSFCELFINNCMVNKEIYKQIKNAVALSVGLNIRFSKSENPFGFKGNAVINGYGRGHYASIIGDRNDK